MGRSDVVVYIDGLYEGSSVTDPVASDVAEQDNTQAEDSTNPPGTGGRAGM